MFSNCLWGKSSLYSSCTTYRLHLVIINGRVNVLYRVFVFPTNTPTCYIFKLFSITSTCTCLKEYGLYRHPHSLRHSTSLLLNTRSGVLPFFGIVSNESLRFRKGEFNYLRLCENKKKCWAIRRSFYIIQIWVETNSSEGFKVCIITLARNMINCVACIIIRMFSIP